MKVNLKHLSTAAASALILYALFVIAFQKETDFSGWAFLLLLFGGGSLFLTGVVGSFYRALVDPNILQPDKDYFDTPKSIKTLNAERRARVEAAKREGKI